MCIQNLPSRAHAHSSYLKPGVRGYLIVYIVCEVIHLCLILISLTELEFQSATPYEIIQYRNSNLSVTKYQHLLI